MNTQIFIRANRFTKFYFIFAILVGLMISTSANADWSVDFSRRFKDVQENDLRAPASLDVPVTTNKKKQKESSSESFSSLWSVSEPSQEIVILNTSSGFVPSTVRLKQGYVYKFHIVNINPKEKNVSFVMDSLSEQHGTYFAEPTTFNIKAEKDGVHKFACPETSIEGRLIIMPNTEVRAPAEAQ